MPAGRGRADARVRAHPICGYRPGHGRSWQRRPLTDAGAATDPDEGRTALRRRQAWLEIYDGAITVGGRRHM
jgi:hypothetical protein